jgi:PD-(D/E)XK endonuclease
MKRQSGISILSPAASGKRRLARNFKWHGEIAEMGFQHKASGMGFAVTKPYGESESYDFIVDSGNRFWRVQVKSGSSMKRDAYRVAVRHFWRERRVKHSYTAEQIDILAAYVVPADAWYIIPVSAFTPSQSLLLFPHIPGHGGKYEQFREAWYLMACRLGGEPKDGIVTSPACRYCPASGRMCPGCAGK